MSFPYAYTPNIWLVLASATLLAVLGIYAIGHRNTEGRSLYHSGIGNNPIDFMSGTPAGTQ